MPANVLIMVFRHIAANYRRGNLASIRQRCRPVPFVKRRRYCLQKPPSVAPVSQRPTLRSYSVLEKKKDFRTLVGTAQRPPTSPGSPTLAICSKWIPRLRLLVPPNTTKGAQIIISNYRLLSSSFFSFLILLRAAPLC